MKRVILCRPEGPRNLGSILRLAQNFGPVEITLVRPERPSMLVHPEFVQMSHGAEDARDAIQVVETLPEALADCNVVVGFTARVRGGVVRTDWREAAPRYVDPGDSEGERLALVFGNEAMGLTSAEAHLCHELVHVRTSVEHTSLNLAMAVCVVLSTLYTGRAVHDAEPGGHLLDGAGREFLKERMKQVFAERVARTPSAAGDISESIERVFSRAPLENRDARAWHLMLRALGSSLTPGELGLAPSRKDGRRLDAMSRRQGPEAGASPGPAPDSGNG